MNLSLWWGCSLIKEENSEFGMCGKKKGVGSLNLTGAKPKNSLSLGWIVEIWTFISQLSCFFSPADSQGKFPGQEELPEVFLWPLLGLGGSENPRVVWVGIKSHPVPPDPRNTEITPQDGEISPWGDPGGVKRKEFHGLKLRGSVMNQESKSCQDFSKMALLSSFSPLWL